MAAIKAPENEKSRTTEFNLVREHTVVVLYLSILEKRHYGGVARISVVPRDLGPSVLCLRVLIYKTGMKISNAAGLSREGKA